MRGRVKLFKSWKNLTDSTYMEEIHIISSISNEIHFGLWKDFSHLPAYTYLLNYLLSSCIDLGRWLLLQLWNILILMMRAPAAEHVPTAN